ncbi:sensor histidine kinase [Streptococcus sp. DD13]|uniref:sensor histidine kinase n=1 Tax=Streptococcus sp. DD13 TaxID=1777881 RepID=UPI00079BD3AB|nr:sensor histidine kinase [Streptococcus sp. DD13]KXT78962.1 Two-component sensor kinase YesM [Streptococcus sp. DD13]
MKKIWLDSLLKVYAVAMFVIVGFVALLISYASWQSNDQEATSIAQRVSTRVADEVENYYQQGVRFTQELAGNQAKLEGLYKYFTLSPGDYATWRLASNLLGIVEVSIHENVSSIYLQNDFVEGFDLTLQDYTTAFVSTRMKQGGKQVEADQFRPSDSAFAIPLNDPFTANHIGTVYMTVSKKFFEKAIDNIRHRTPVLVKISSPYGKTMMTFGEGKGAAWLKQETTHGYVVEVAIPDSYRIGTTISNTVFVIGLSLILTISLYFILRGVFRNYQLQVSDLVETIQTIGQGDSDRRINTESKEQELLLIANNTNTMLDNLEKNIHDIYQLQISQKDANMRALQAQIDPHFMYNTLEFIRMYAVMEKQEELADIIYEFSSLLRNNISDESKTTLKQELEFCRKYSYLCMIRHPKSVAYGFKIDPSLDNLTLPKFTIQPLIENYFAHGVDYRRNDNVISVKAMKVKDTIQIRIQDNGRGMSAEKLNEIRQILSSRTVQTTEEKEQRKSIGIINIHERFLLFFGDRYSIQVDSVEDHGVTYMIEIKDTE